MEKDVICGMISWVLEKICNSLSYFIKNKPILCVTGWSFNPMDNTVVVHLDNSNDDNFDIKKIGTEGNLKYAGSCPINVLIGDSVDLRFCYMGNLKQSEKDNYCVTLHIAKKVLCRYKYKLYYKNGHIYYE